MSQTPLTLSINMYLRPYKTDQELTLSSRSIGFLAVMHCFKKILVYQIFSIYSTSMDILVSSLKFVKIDLNAYPVILPAISYSR